MTRGTDIDFNRAMATLDIILSFLLNEKNIKMYLLECNKKLNHDDLYFNKSKGDKPTEKRGRNDVIICLLHSFKTF